MFQRKQKGYSILELMVTISLIGVVIGMLYMYNNRGWKLFNKAKQFNYLQINARASLEQIAFNLKQAAADLIYVDSNFNSNVPLPSDALFGKPYIYFAVPQSNKRKIVKNYNGGNGDSAAITKHTGPFDYYLYYIAQATDRNGDFTRKKAKMKLFEVKGVDGDYTMLHAHEWPFLPPQLLGQANYETHAEVKNQGLPVGVEYQDMTEEFSTYDSLFAYNYFNTNYKNLFTMKVKLVDPNTNTRVNFETSVSPRN